MGFQVSGFEFREFGRAWVASCRWWGGPVCARVCWDSGKGSGDGGLGVGDFWWVGWRGMLSVHGHVFAEAI